MARSFRRVSCFAFPAEAVFDALVDPLLLEARHRHQGAISVHCLERQRSDAKLMQDVRVEESVKTLTGMDRNRRAWSTTTYDWDLAARRGRWRYSGPHGERVRVAGELCVVEREQGCELHASFFVSVGVPLIAGSIERRIVAEIEAELPALDELVRDWCTRKRVGESARG